MMTLPAWLKASVWLPAMLLLWPLVAVAEPDRERSAAANASALKTPPGLWDRIVILGASASDGFLATEPLGGPRTGKYRIHRYFDAALVAPHGEIKNLASRLLFLAPLTMGKLQVETARPLQPTLVVAIDFPFWFCYGVIESEPARLQSLAQGLKLLEVFACPVIVGDLPDCKAALGTMLSERQIPAPETLVKANAQIRAWAASRPNVCVAGLAEFVKCAQANTPYCVHTHTWHAGKTKALIQPDHLHPDCPGCAALTLAAFEALLKSNTPFAEKDVCWNPEEVCEGGVQAEVDFPPDKPIPKKKEKEKTPGP